MNRPFKLTFNLTKSYQGEDGQTYVEGIASGTEVDLTGERMSITALQSMVDSLKQGIVEFRSEHSHDWDAAIGEVVSLSLNEDNKLVYKAKLDTGFSKARDLVHALSKGTQLGVSIGGQVLEAGMEWVEELQRSVYTYFGIILKEISVTGTAAYQYSWIQQVTKSLDRNQLEVVIPEIAKAKTVPATKVHAMLSKVYPEKVLGWVDDAEWRMDDAVPLNTINMARRPGGRDQSKVEGIAQAIADGKKMDPVVLVDDGTDKLQIADGYHRTLAFEHAKKTTIPAYIGSSLEPGGPWEKAMHDAKLNKSMDEQEETPVAEQPAETAVTPSEQEVETPVTAEEAPVADPEPAHPAEEAPEADPAPETDQEPTAEEAPAAEPEVAESTEPAEDAAPAATDPAPDQEAEAPEAASDPAPAEGADTPAVEANDEVEALNKSLDAKTQELDAVVKSLAEVTKQLEERDARLAGLEATITEKDAAISAAQATAEEAQQALAKTQAKAETEAARKSYQVTSKFALALDLKEEKQPEDKNPHRAFAAWAAGIK